jgi:predicted TIM-barrel fold metal-dependent hydrolase
MIIDVRTHVWSSLEQLGREIAQRLRARAAERFEQYEAAIASHDRAMACVDASLVFGFRSDRLGAQVPNELVAEFAAADSRRRLGVGGIDPMNPGAMQHLKACSELGLVAINVSPACQGFHPAHSTAMRVYERCAEMGLPIFVTMFDPLTPSAMLEFARPALWDEVAQAFPSLPIVFAGFGYPWIDETLMMLGKHGRLFADTSGVANRPWQLYNALQAAAGMGVMEKLLFASGFPFGTPEDAIEAIYSVNSYSHGTQLPSVPRSQIRSIVERDSLACLGVEAEIAVRRAPAADDSAADFVVETRPQIREALR